MPQPYIHNIDPVIGQIGGVYLWWYGLAYTIGFLGLFHWLRTVRDYLGIDVRQVYDLSILVALGVLIGGRAVEVIFYEWEYYGRHLSHIFWVWLGGMSTHGVLFGATLGVWIFCRRHKKSFLEVADELVLPAAFMMGIGRIGNFIDGQIVGGVTDVWWAVWFPDIEGFRHPVVLYDGLKNLLIVPLLLLLRSAKLPRGVLLGTFLFCYGFFRIFIDFFREYRTELLGLPPGQEFNLGMTVAGIALIIWSMKRRYPGVKPVTRSDVMGGLNMDVRRATRVRRIILRALLVLPLLIPSDWTQDVTARYGHRHKGMTHSTIYPKIQHTSSVDTYEADKE